MNRPYYEVSFLKPYVNDPLPDNFLCLRETIDIPSDKFQEIVAARITMGWCVNKIMYRDVGKQYDKERLLVIDPKSVFAS